MDPHSLQVRWVAWPAIVVLAAASVAFLARVQPRGGNFGLDCVLAATVAWLVVLACAGRFPSAISMRAVAVVAVALGIAAVVAPPRQSADLYSYVMYGRIAAVHHANPYVALPSSFRRDPMLHLVSRAWLRTPSRYGVVFTAFSALGAWFFGTGQLALRLWFQLAALLAVGVMATIVWRRTRSVAALAFVALNPFVLLSVVNGGHNDALLALGLLAGVLLVRDDHLLAGATVLAATSLVKLTAVLAIVGVVAWLLLRRRLRAAVVVGGLSGALTAVGTFGMPGAYAAVKSGDAGTTRVSVWRLVRLATERHSVLPWHGPVLSADQFRNLVTIGVPLVALAALVIGMLWLGGRGGLTLEVAAVLGVSAYAVLGGWVLPWYAVWALPLAAVAGSARLRWVVALHGALLLAVQQVPIAEWTEPRPDLVFWLLVSIPVVLAVLYGLAIFAAPRPARI